MGLFFGTEKRAVGWTVEPPIPPYLGASLDGSVNVGSNPDQALQVPTVWACVSLLAGTVSSLPLETFDQPANSGMVPRRLDDPALVKNPDDTMTQSEWLHMLMVSLLLRGNAYGLITDRDFRGYPTKIHLLSPDAVRLELDRETGRMIYRFGHDNRPIPREDMWHVRGLTMPGSRVGLSPISYAAAAMGLDLSARQFANQFFDGGGIPKAVIESDQQITQEQARTLKDRIMASFRGREPFVMGMGTKYTQIQVSPEESQFLATQQANVSQIARYFGPTIPMMVGGNEGNSMTYSNREQRSLDYLTYDVAHWLKRIEDAMFGLFPGRQYVRFNVQHLLRTDAETQAKVFVQYLAGKVLTPTEVRAELGRDKMTKAQQDEVDLVPMNITAAGSPYMNRPQAKAQTLASDGGPQGSQTEPPPASGATLPAPPP